MKLLFSAFILCTIIPLSYSQGLNLPLQSPNASVGFTVGYTDFQVKYGSPAVEKRKIWNEAVPYNEVWLAGANKATTIEFSTHVNIEGTELEAGRYAFLLIPKEGDKWTAIFNSETSLWGTAKYDQGSDVARVEVPVKFVNVSQERLSYEIIDQTSEQGYIKMAWGKARVYVRFLVEVVDEAMAQVDAAIEAARADQKWMIYARGADFLLETGKQLDQAMEWADMASELKEHSFSWWVRARALAEKDMIREAIDSGKKAIQFGKSSPRDTYYSSNATQIIGQMESWVKQVNSSGVRE